MPDIMKQKPLLSFEFPTPDGETKPKTFKNPVQVITTEKLEDVLSCLQLVEDAVQKGYYAAGFISYEGAAAFEPAFSVREGGSMPLLWFGIFSEPDHIGISSNHPYSLSEWMPSVTQEEYRSAISAIKQAIANGISYQTNYTIRLDSQFAGDDIAFFEQLKRAQASNYCAYLNTGEHSILSASPELFFQLNGNHITTRPMKGTLKRGNTFNEDKENASWLYHSEKNRAENVMIVDLLRNDLGIIAEPGTVTVEKLFNIEQYPTVHQMTSTISAKVSPNVTLTEIFKALFPCGSITGAPKISTMELITQLEKAPREVYCGAIGYISPDGKATFSVPIRTVMIDHKTGQATYGVGGGITWDSTAEGEYDEILAKASLLKQDLPDFQLIESLLLENERYFLLEEHLNRIKNSAQYFGFQFQIADAEKYLLKYASQQKEKKQKVRFLLAKNGEMNIEGNEVGKSVGPKKVIVATSPVHKNNPFLYHKTTNRDIYYQYQKNKPAEIFDILLWNENGEITEFTNGNIVLEIDGIRWTPSVKSGLLAGTFRESLIKTKEIRERTLSIEDLNYATKIWFINSVRKWVQVRFV
ncbi:aminodeoxychorismate synthase component I [Bacillus sp. T3]|uniref:aminodeoxychorismate synthase component I n=1 Tax=Bacillus sp. T3 TaxID=467262 RepID=UPI002980FDFE|nr:aminodeoxychorismate synthase component I [Bacillus sp. T3]